MRFSYHLGAFGTVWLSYETRWKTGRTSANVRATKRVRIFRSERTRSTLFDPKLTFWCIRDYLVALRYSVQNGPNKCKRSCHEVASDIFATNAPDPPHWTLNLHFGVFRNIWVHSGQFGRLTKLGAKRAELVQKFVPRSRI